MGNSDFGKFILYEYVIKFWVLFYAIFTILYINYFFISKVGREKQHFLNNNYFFETNTDILNTKVILTFIIMWLLLFLSYSILK